MDLFKKVAKMFLFMIVITMIFTVIMWGVIIVNSNNLIESKLTELVIIVSDENCLSDTGGVNSTLAIFNTYLESSETSWLKFNTSGHNGDPGKRMDYRISAQAPSPIIGKRSDIPRNFDVSYYVGGLNNSTPYFNYSDAPQRGEVIKVSLTGYVWLPLMMDTNNVGNTVETGDNQLGVILPIRKVYNTMGLRFYKGK